MIIIADYSISGCVLWSILSLILEIVTCRIVVGKTFDSCCTNDLLVTEYRIQIKVVKQFEFDPHLISYPSLK